MKRRYLYLLLFSVPIVLASAVVAFAVFGAAVGATVLLLSAVAAYQWHVGNIGPKTDDVLCADFCRAEGFAGSGMPPRNAGVATCTCFDPQGRETVSVPMETVVPRQ